MFKFLTKFFKKKPATIDSILLYPEGKRYYKESHIVRKHLIDEDALKVIRRLDHFKYRSYIVGGGVRDILLGRKPKDFDVVTNATPNQIKNIFNNCRIIGRRFKIAHVIFKGKVIEVSTFRSLPEHRLTDDQKKGEKNYFLKSDNNFGTAKEDAARRDFTINSLYFDPRNESIIDFVGGFADIQNKVLKVIGDPEISFKEDPVRMLRAVKFSFLHGLTIDKQTKAALKKHRNEIEKASSSRMLEEYNKIFRTGNSAQILKGLAENHLLEVMLKEPLEKIRKNSPDWQEDFLKTSIGIRLEKADKMIKDKLDLTPVVFWAIIFHDLVIDHIKSDSANLVHSIKLALDPAMKHLEIPKRDKDKLIKIYASQKRFGKKDEAPSKHNEVFCSKDYFLEAFMYFKIDALARGDNELSKSSLFWEINYMNSNGQKIEEKHQTSFNNRKFPPKKRFPNQRENYNREQNRKEFPEKTEKPKIEETEKDIVKPVSENPIPTNQEGIEIPEKPKFSPAPFKRNRRRFRNRKFRPNKNSEARPQSEGSESDQKPES